MRNLIGGAFLFLAAIEIGTAAVEAVLQTNSAKGARRSGKSEF
jgi:hypothetical protein